MAFLDTTFAEALKDKTVVVTGASGALGAGVASSFVDMGAQSYRC